MRQNLAVLFPLLSVAVWLMATTVLGLLSGWFKLVAEYPDQAIEPNQRLRGQSGRIGLVSMRGILTLSVCTSGLRVGMMRFFGPFCRYFFVPWERIAVVRTTTLFSPAAELQFGDPPGHSRSPLILPTSLLGQRWGVGRRLGYSWKKHAARDFGDCWRNGL